MTGKTSLTIGVAVLLVAGALTWVKVGGGGDGEKAVDTGERSGRKAGRRAGGREGEPARKGVRPVRTGGRRGDTEAQRAQMAISTLSETEAAGMAKAWIDHVRQRKDPRLREEAISAIKAALEGGDEMEAYAALQACAAIKGMRINRDGFRELVERHLDALDPGMRRSAWYAFATTERRPEDLVRVRKLAYDPAEQVRKNASHLMSLFEKGDFTGESGSVVLRMLHDEDKPMRKEILRGISGAKLSPGLEAKVIELSRSDDRSELHETVYYALSTQVNKSPATVNRLIEVLGDSDVGNIASRAAWGLRYGVPEAVRPQVAEAALGLLETPARGQMWSHGIELLGRFGTDAHRSAIETLASDPAATPQSRATLERLLQRIR